MGKQGMTVWQKWLERPDKLWVRNMFFQVHFWIGAAAGAYILLMSVSGSVIVYRNELSGNSFVEWVVRLHENLLSGTTGRFVNGIGDPDPGKDSKRLEENRVSRKSQTSELPSLHHRKEGWPSDQENAAKPPLIARPGWFSE